MTCSFALVRLAGFLKKVAPFHALGQRLAGFSISISTLLGSEACMWLPLFGYLILAPVFRSSFGHFACLISLGSPISVPFVGMHEPSLHVFLKEPCPEKRQVSHSVIQSMPSFETFCIELNVWKGVQHLVLTYPRCIASSESEANSKRHRPGSRCPSGSGMPSCRCIP